MYTYDQRLLNFIIFDAAYNRISKSQYSTPSTVCLNAPQSQSSTSKTGS